MSNIKWTNHLIEFFTVVLGILLAFGLNTYYNNRLEQERVSHYLEGVKLEIEENAKEVSQKLEYHNKIRSELVETPLKVNLQLRASRVKDFAWQIAQENAISQHISYDVYKKLAEIYSIQSTLNQNAKEAGNMMSHMNVLSPFYVIGVDVSEEEEEKFLKRIKQGWIPIFEDFIYYESQLDTLYIEAINSF
ncbi:hypothetical protein [Reichenbachiella sp.]|uniref:hypothetical protein n=1 Tax=Reichenbachiella sp. TaxID=2184521 RepID=UPI003BB051AD